MNNRKPTLMPSLPTLERSQRNMNLLKENMNGYQRFNISNDVQYISSRYSNFSADITVPPWIPQRSAKIFIPPKIIPTSITNISVPPRSASSCSASTPRVPVSSAIRQIAVVLPKHRALSNSNSLNIGTENLSGAKPKYTHSSLIAERKICHKIGVDTMSAADCGAGPSENADEDVVYMYTVDCSSDGTVVEQINLDDESETTITPSQPESGKDAAIESIDLTVKMSRKRKGIPTSKQSRKRAKKGPEVKCSSCSVKYGDIAATCLYITRCGHLLCRLCVEEKLKSCKVCGERVTKYRKVYI